MKKKSIKSLVVLVLMTTLLLSTVITSNAYTTSSWVQSQQRVSYYAFNNGSNLNANYQIKFNTFLKGSDIRIPVNNDPSLEDVDKSEDIENNGPSLEDVEVEEPQNPEKPDEYPIEVPNPETNVPPQETVPQPVEPVPPVEDTSNEKHSLSAAEIEMVKYVNQARAEAGLQPLAIDVDLSYVARVKSKDMQDNNYFNHTSPTYGSPFDMMKKFGIQYRSAAENIAINSSVMGAHNAFMNSEGHRNNILNPNMTHIGIGIVNRHYTQMFIQK